MNNTMVLAPDGVALLDQWRGKMKQGGWGDGKEAVCMMSALVPGAQSIDECVTAGWPEWMVNTCIVLYDALADTDNQLQTAVEWAYSVAEAVSKPVDYDKAYDRLLIVVLESVQELDRHDLAQPAIDLLKRRIEGEDDDDGFAFLELVERSDKVYRDLLEVEWESSEETRWKPRMGIQFAAMAQQVAGYDSPQATVPCSVMRNAKYAAAMNARHGDYADSEALNRSMAAEQRGYLVAALEAAQSKGDG